MKHSYVLIDDDHESILRTQSFFDQFPDYSIAGTANNLEDALNLILKTKPNIVFLEISSENKNCDLSLDLINKVRQFSNKIPKFVVLSLDKNLAYTALKHEVYDFLIKPTNLDELRKTIYRYQRDLNVSAKTICVKSHSDHRFLSLDELLYCKADNSYTEIFLKSGEMVTAFKMLKYFEQILPPPFFRIHNSHIVNMNFVSRINICTGFCYIKDTKIRIPFSKHYKQNIDLIISLLSDNENKIVNEIQLDDVLDELNWENP